MRPNSGGLPVEDGERFRSIARPGGADDRHQQAPCSEFVAASENMLEMWMERDPPKWAAYQIAAKGSECKTVGEAMDMIEGIVRQAMNMMPND